MSSQLDLKQAERKAWTIYFRDGLFDIFLGLVFLGSGLRSLTDSLWYYLLVLAAIIILYLGKRFITTPRLGLIRFGPQRQKRNQLLKIITFLAVLLTGLVFIFTLIGLLNGSLQIGIFLAIMAPTIMVLLGYLMDFQRLYLYAILTAVFMLVTELTNSQMGAYFQVISGLIPLLVGAYFFVRFLNEYPIPEEHSPAVEGQNGR